MSVNFLNYRSFTANAAMCRLFPDRAQILVVQAVNRTISNYLKLPFIKGLIIIEIDRNSPAEKNNLNLGDVILSVNNIAVNKPVDIRNIILENDLRAGDDLSLKVFTSSEYKTIKLKLGKYK